MSKRTDESDLMNYQTDFEGSKSESTGGVTGSGETKSKITQKKYQLKKSIRDASFTRQRLDSGLDHENFGEVISATIGRALTGANIRGNEQSVPKVSLVPDKKTGKTYVASEYLEGASGTVDDYAVKEDKIKKRNKIVKKASKNKPAKIKEDHVTVSFTESKSTGTVFALGGDNRAQLRKDCAEGLALAALSGNHDVNPGNFVMTKENGQDRMRPIDFGKAFNKLLSGAKVLGGQMKNNQNRALDFINRETVSHVSSSKRQSKLWKNYEGVVPSQELADAFKKMGSSTDQQLKTGLKDAKESFIKLLQTFDPEHKPDLSPELSVKEKNKAIKHITDSLQKINKNIKGSKITTNDPEMIINQVFENIGTFYETGKKQMLDAGKLIELQVNIDKSIKAEQKGEKPDKKLLDEINKSYEELKKAPGIGNNKGGIEWAKTDKKTPAHRGTLEDYMTKRRAELSTQTIMTRTRSNAIPEKPKHIGNKNSFLRHAVNAIKNKISSTKLHQQTRTRSGAVDEKINSKKNNSRGR